jgi:hypothetical protein
MLQEEWCPLQQAQERAHHVIPLLRSLSLIQERFSFWNFLHAALSKLLLQLFPCLSDQEQLFPQIWLSFLSLVWLVCLLIWSELKMILVRCLSCPCQKVFSYIFQWTLETDLHLLLKLKLELKVATLGQAHLPLVRLRLLQWLERLVGRLVCRLSTLGGFLSRC